MESESDVPGFKIIEGSERDYLAPFEDRVEPAQQDEAPEVLEQEEWGSSLSEDEPIEGAEEVSETARVETTRTFRENCENVQVKAQQRRVWAASFVGAFEKALKDQIQLETPLEADYEARNQVIQRIDSLVRSGLLQFKGMYVDHYGSFTSGLFDRAGDLDIAIEGCLELQSDSRRRDPSMDALDGKVVGCLDNVEKAKLLRELCKSLRQKQVCRGRDIESILHARVPIIKFVEGRSGIPCDMAVGSKGARFKSTVLRYLTEIDGRFPQLMRVVKSWAKAHHMNNASNGTFNTFALTLMVVFHLQTRHPPILPPICKLFDLPADSVAERPLHRGRAADMSLLEGAEKRAKEWRAEKNTETLPELLSGFFALFTTSVAIWIQHKPFRPVRCCTWAGQWCHKAWPRNYIVSIEDPFDTTDNCGRSIFAVNAEYLTRSFKSGLLALQNLSSDSDVQDAMRALFEAKEEPRTRHPFRAGDFREGWGAATRGNSRAGKQAPPEGQQRDGEASDVVSAQQKKGPRHPRSRRHNRSQAQAVDQAQPRVGHSNVFYPQNGARSDWLGNAVSMGMQMLMGTNSSHDGYLPPPPPGFSGPMGQPLMMGGPPPGFPGQHGSVPGYQPSGFWDASPSWIAHPPQYDSDYVQKLQHLSIQPDQTTQAGSGKLSEQSPRKPPVHPRRAGRQAMANRRGWDTHGSPRQGLTSSRETQSEASPNGQEADSERKRSMFGLQVPQRDPINDRWSSGNEGPMSNSITTLSGAAGHLERLFVEAAERYSKPGTNESHGVMSGAPFASSEDAVQSHRREPENRGGQLVDRWGQRKRHPRW